MKHKQLLQTLISAVVLITLSLLLILFVDRQWLEAESASAAVLGEAKYPSLAPYPNDSLVGYGEWNQDKTRRRKQYRGYEDALDAFFAKTVPEFLADANEQTIVYSPLNVYMALSMLAEITDGTSRQQILDLIQVDSIDALRTQSNAIWNANYCDDGAVTSILANSLWLRDGMKYKPEPINILAEQYYASTYQGNPTSRAYNQAYQNWLNDQTGGLLKQQIKDLNFSSEMIITLASTIYFKAKWDDEFAKEDTVQDIFYSNDGEITCDFMKQSMDSCYYGGEQFSAVQLPLEESGAMYILLPDEGVDLNTILSDESAMQFLVNPMEWKNQRTSKVHLSLPKFDVNSQLQLVTNLKKLGVTDVFDALTSDFTPLLEPEVLSFVSSVLHGARVQIDEEGCIAAAYTEIMSKDGAMFLEDEVTFTVNRPFLFMITSEVGSPLFVGTVNQPNT